MYVKPQLVRFGSVRELTQLGAREDCDGGVFGNANGSSAFCYDSGRS
jgi:hypothetical protein